MKPLILVLLFFVCTGACAQGRFVEKAYTDYYGLNKCFDCPFETHYTVFLYNDTSVELKMVTRVYMRHAPRSSVRIFYGLGKITNNILSVTYTSSNQTPNQLSKLKVKYLPAPNERIFYPPTTFIIKGETITDLNNDFPVLNKVSPAVAMNTPQPK